MNLSQDFALFKHIHRTLVPANFNNRYIEPLISALYQILHHKKVTSLCYTNVKLCKFTSTLYAVYKS